MPRPKAPEVPCGNPLFLSWVGEWMENAKKLNSKGYQIYKRAYESIKQCPIAYEHPSELIRLHGIGPGICKKLEDKLKAYCSAEDLPTPLKPGHAPTASQEAGEDVFLPSQACKRRAPAKPYIPRYRSGGWAILRALETFPPDVFVTKAEIVRVAHQYCDSSFDVAIDNKFYTAWSSIKQLLERGYVYKTGNPPRYCLTEEGAEVAKTIKVTDTGPQGNPECPSQKRQRSEEPQVTWISPDSLLNSPITLAVPVSNTSRLVPQASIGSSNNPHVLPPGEYSIQLVMDNREIHSQVDRERLERAIGEAGIKYSVRNLDIGDALWIAKSGSDEYVLDYIVERKRMDDLVSSITDGRFHEQKFRLMKSGMRHVIYIIEDYAGYDASQFLEAIQTSISSSQAVNNFFVKRCKNIQETVEYLQRMSKFVIKLHQGRALTVIPESQIDARTFYNLKSTLEAKNVYHCVRYQDFAAISSKSASLNIGDVFLKMLMSVRGVSAEKAIEIQKYFPTIITLVEELAKVDEEKGKKLLAERCSQYGRKKIGNVLSAKIYDVFKPQ